LKNIGKIKCIKTTNLLIEHCNGLNEISSIQFDVFDIDGFCTYSYLDTGSYDKYGEKFFLNFQSILNSNIVEFDDNGRLLSDNSIEYISFYSYSKTGKLLTYEWINNYSGYPAGREDYFYDSNEKLYCIEKNDFETDDSEKTFYTYDNKGFLSSLSSTKIKAGIYEIEEVDYFYDSNQRLSLEKGYKYKRTESYRTHYYYNENGVLIKKITYTFEKFIGAYLSNIVLYNDFGLELKNFVYDVDFNLINCYEYKYQDGQEFISTPIDSEAMKKRTTGEGVIPKILYKSWFFKKNHNNASKQEFSISYEYDEEDRLIREIHFPNDIIYNYSDFDKYGNWTKCITYNRGMKSETLREFIYY
jgi:hypothetical protein